MVYHAIRKFFHYQEVNQPPLILTYPNKSKIQPCGEYVKGRSCKTSRRGLNKKKPIKIRFMPEDYFEDGNYLPDNGATYGSHGKPYGWSKDMSSKIRQYNEASQQDLHTLVEFNPSEKSRICSKPGTNCEKVNWSVKTGNGRFFVRLFVGDPESKSKVDLKVNSKFLAKNQIIPQDTLKIYEGIVEAKNEFLVVKSECQTDCDNGVSKLNAIEITPYKEKPKNEEIKTKEVALACGHAFTGGRCDKGPNVVHCLFEDPSKPVAGNCTGNLVIMMIPNTYQCKDQIGKYKCLKKQYENDEECKKYCVNNCKKNICIGE